MVPELPGASVNENPPAAAGGAPPDTATGVSFSLKVEEPRLQRMEEEEAADALTMGIPAAVAAAGCLQRE